MLFVKIIYVNFFFFRPRFVQVSEFLNSAELGSRIAQFEEKKSLIYGGRKVFNRAE